MTTVTRRIGARILQVRQTLGVDVCSFYQADASSETVTMLASAGLERIVGTRLSYQQGLTGKVARTRKPVAARDIQTHADYFHVEGSGEERFTSYLGIPLEYRGDLLGVLIVQTKDSKTFFHRDIQELYAAGREIIALLVDQEAAP